MLQNPCSPRPFSAGLAALAALALGALTAGCGGSGSSPVLIGRLEPSTQARALGPGGRDLPVQINGELRTVPVDSTLTFTVQDLPTGKISFGVELNGIKGTIALENVVPGEVIEIVVRTGPDRLEISVTRREPPKGGMNHVSPPPSAGPIVLRGDHITYYLDPGKYHGDLVIEGKHVTVIGHNDGSCDESHRSLIEGKLVVKGKQVRILNVAVQGAADIQAKQVRFISACGDGSAIPGHGRNEGDGENDDD